MKYVIALSLLLLVAAVAAAPLAMPEDVTPDGTRVTDDPDNNTWDKRSQVEGPELRNAKKRILTMIFGEQQSQMGHELQSGKMQTQMERE
jgi:hypothetical protein